MGLKDLDLNDSEWSARHTHQAACVICPGSTYVEGVQALRTWLKNLDASAVAKGSKGAIRLMNGTWRRQRCSELPSIRYDSEPEEWRNTEDVVPPPMAGAVAKVIRLKGELCAGLAEVAAFMQSLEVEGKEAAWHRLADVVVLLPLKHRSRGISWAGITVGLLQGYVTPERGQAGRW